MNIIFNINMNIQFIEHEKHCKYISELESLEQEKLYSKGYSVTNNETLSTNFERKRLLINFYLNNAKVKGLWYRGSMVSLLGKKWLSEMLPDISSLLLNLWLFQTTI